MRLRSPAEYYIKYLVSHPNKYSTYTVKERLIDEGLIFISEEYIDRLRSRMTLPDPFCPEDPDHIPSLDFILSQGINRLYQPDLSMKIAKDVLATPRAKEFVETALISHPPLASIANAIAQRHQIYCTAPAIEVYKHYFWNIDLVDSTQLRLLLSLQVELSAAHVPELKGHQDILRHAYYQDSRKVAAEMPYTPMGAMMAQMRLGVAPTQRDLSLRMMEARNMSMARTGEAIYRDGPHDSQRALNYATTTRILEEFMQMALKPEDQMREQLQSIALRTDTQPMKSIHQLSAGRHTVDVAPTKDLLHDDADIIDEPGDPEPGPGDLDSSE